MFKKLIAILSFLILFPLAANSFLFVPPPIPQATTTAPINLFQTSVQNTSVGSSTYAPTGLAFGTANASRIIIVCVSGTAAGAVTVSSATIGGIAGTIAKQNAGATRGVTALITAAVPTGTTGTVSVTFSASMTRAAIGVWATYNLISQTPTATNSANTTAGGQSQSLNVNVTATNLVYGCSYDNGDSGLPSPSWTGLTQDYNKNGASDGNSGASLTAISTQSPRTVTMTWTTSSQGDGVSAVFN